MFVLYRGNDAKSVLGCFTTMQKLLEVRHGLASPGTACAVEIPLDRSECACTCLLCIDKSKPERSLDEGFVVHVRHHDWSGFNDKPEDCRILGVYSTIDKAPCEWGNPGYHHVNSMPINTLQPEVKCECSFCEDYAVEKEEERVRELAFAEKELNKAKDQYIHRTQRTALYDKHN